VTFAAISCRESSMAKWPFPCDVSLHPVRPCFPLPEWVIRRLRKLAE